MSTEAETVYNIVKSLHAGPVAMDGVPAGGAILVPGGFSIANAKPIIDAFRARPEFTEGTAVLADTASLIAHINRAKRPESVLFANASSGVIEAVYDYDSPGGSVPGRREHKAHTTLAKSREFAAWTAGDAKTQQQFGEFIDERGAALILPPDGATADPDDPDVRFGKPSEIRALAKAFRLHTKQTIEASEGPGGNVSVSFLSENMTRDGRPIDVPTAFWVSIPLFEGEDEYPTPVRVRLRFKTEANGNTSIVRWTMKCEGSERLFAKMFRERAKRVAADTGLPLFFGASE